MKRTQWRIGRIRKLIKGRDSNVRAAEVNVITNDKLSVLKRPITKLYPVEFNEQNEETDDSRNEIKFVSDLDTITFLCFGECSSEL